MTGDIDNIVSARHHIEIAVFVNKAGIAGFVIAWKIFHIGGLKTVMVLPQPGQAAGWQRCFDDNGAGFVGGNRLAVFI